MTVAHRRGRFIVDLRAELHGRVERFQLTCPPRYQSQRGAEQYERLVLAELHAGRDPRRRGEEDETSGVATKRAPTLAEFAETFLTDYASINNEGTTVVEKRRTIARSLVPLLGHLRLDEINARQIEAYKAQRLASKTRKKKAPANKTVNEELAILSKLLRVALEWELIEKMPLIRRLRARQPGFDFLDFEEAERLTVAASKEGAPWCAMVPVALLTGLRLGELRALRWDDVDLVGRRLHVRHSMDDHCNLKCPKNGRTRIVDLPRRAVVLLKAHKHLRGEYVFCREDGRPLPRWACESKTVAQKHDHALARACRRAGLRRIGWHGLRHTYASHLMMRGAHVTEVKELMGHATLAMTMRYSHLSPKARRAAADLLDGGDNLVTGHHGEARTRS